MFWHVDGALPGRYYSLAPRRSGGAACASLLSREHFFIFLFMIILISIDNRDVSHTRARTHVTGLTQYRIYSIVVYVSWNVRCTSTRGLVVKMCPYFTLFYRACVPLRHIYTVKVYSRRRPHTHDAQRTSTPTHESKNPSASLYSGHLSSAVAYHGLAYNAHL